MSGDRLAVSGISPLESGPTRAVRSPPRQRVRQFVEMLAFARLDLKLAGDTAQFRRATVSGNTHLQVTLTTFAHDPAMHEDETAPFTIERAGKMIQGNITRRRARHGRPRTDHGPHRLARK